MVETRSSTKKKHKQMADAVKGGLSVADAVRFFNVSERTIRGAMAVNKVSMSDKGRPLVILAAIYRAVPLRGMVMTSSLADIARRTKVTRQRVSQVFEEAKSLKLLKRSLTPGP